MRQVAGASLNRVGSTQREEFMSLSVVTDKAGGKSEEQGMLFDTTVKLLLLAA